MGMRIPDINLNTIRDPATRAAMQQLLIIIETQHADVVGLRAENQRLRDEVARLKGGNPKPPVPPTPSAPPAPPASSNHSSEAERHTPTPHRKRPKANQLVPTRIQRCALNPATLPPDAQRRATTITTVQDLRLVADVVAFHRDTWYAASTKRTFTAPLPPGYTGAFGPHIRSLVAVLAHVTLVSEPQIHQLCTTAGIAVSAGTIHTWTTHLPAALHAEAVAVGQAGLASSPWQQIDATPTVVHGQQHACQVVGNPLYTRYHTQRTQQRQAIVTTLLNGHPVRYRLNADACAQLTAHACPPAVLAALRAAVPWDIALDAATLTACLPPLAAQWRRQVPDQLAIAAYHAQTDVPVVRLLLCDDARQYHDLTDDLALCWVHEGRHLAMLRPIVPQHQRALARIRQHFWVYYRALRAYQAAPTAAERTRLQASFTRLVTRRTGYPDLDARLALLASKRESLLPVLDHPELPLHNNAMELGARRRVRKRDISFGPRSGAGVRAWDTCMTLVATAQKLGVNVIAYFHDRLSGVCALPALADVLIQRASTANLGASWATT